MSHDHPVFRAARKSDPAELRQILDAEPSLVDARGWLNATPLLEAVRADSAPVVRLLLERGADVSVRWGNADYPLLHAAVSGEVARAVIDAAQGRDLDATDELDYTVLERAVSDKRTEVVRVLLEAGAGRSLELEPADIATRPHQGLTIHPFQREARTSTFNGAVVVQWQLEPTVAPTRIISDTTTGGSLWDKRIDDTTVGADGGPYPASLCFTTDGAWLCVGLDAGVLWIDSTTGTRTRIDTTTGVVAALGCTPHTGMLATTATGVHRVGEPSLPGGTSPSPHVR